MTRRQSCPKTNVRIWLESYCTGEFHIGVMAEIIIFNLSIWGAAASYHSRKAEKRELDCWKTRDWTGLKCWRRAVGLERGLSCCSAGKKLKAEKLKGWIKCCIDRTRKFYLCCEVTRAAELVQFALCMAGQSAGKLDWDHQFIVSEHQSSGVKSNWTEKIWMDSQKIKIKTWIQTKWRSWELQSWIPRES